HFRARIATRHRTPGGRNAIDGKIEFRDRGTRGVQDPLDGLRRLF
ncbi:unnamed protein product, partial [Ascophyllum nodosum]